MSGGTGGALFRFDEAFLQKQEDGTISGFVGHIDRGTLRKRVLSADPGLLSPESPAGIQKTKAEAEPAEAVEKKRREGPRAIWRCATTATGKREVTR